MSEKKRNSTPPVIRVFLSSTFADMEHERSYFNEVLAPKLGRICSERGVSFFNVDLRWGITEEDQIGGQVLPICLGEIDKCRPYFIGIIGNRYGSLMETVPLHVAETIPWLEGKEGISITELEMLYAVLDSEKDDPAVNSAFYMRSDRLSGELYPDLVSENGAALEKLEKLKSIIRSDSSVLCSDYDTIEEFGEKVLNDLVRWLDENFPESGDVAEIRREWYNGEILRGHIENSQMHAFLDSYIESSRHSLLIFGDGARGKTACLTAWEPKNAKKILINCASDEVYRQPKAIMLRVMYEICDYLTGEDEIRLRDLLDEIDVHGGDIAMSESGREKIRMAFLTCINVITPQESLAVVINDLQLVSDSSGNLLSWFPVVHKKINFICSTNDIDTVENADIVRWNTKEMPLFDEEGARELIDNSLRTYGKNLSGKQFDLILHSSAAKYPGQLRFVISFLLNHGRFNNLDRLTGDIAAITEICGIYRYVYDFLISGLPEREKCAACEVFGLLRASDLALSEGDCFELAHKVSNISKIEWADVCRIFEQFDLIHGDYWYIRDEETEKFVDELISVDKMNEIHNCLADYLYDKLFSEKESSANIVKTFAYAKQIVASLRSAKSYDKLLKTLCDTVVAVALASCEQTSLRSAWMDLFLNTEYDVGEAFVGVVKNVAEHSKEAAVDVCKIINDLNMPLVHIKACEAIGVEPNDAVTVDLWMDELSPVGLKIYKTLYNMKQKGAFREIKETLDKMFRESKVEFTPVDVCQMFFFKTDAESRLGIYEDALESGNMYYKSALKTGSVENIRNALSMRSSVLYRLGRVKEALAIIKRTEKMAYSAGKTRDYLSCLNLKAICYYRISRLEESIGIFNRLVRYWEKLGDKREVCSSVINKCNALYISERVDEALDVAEKFYESIKTDVKTRDSWASLCGNIGLYAFELGQYEKAEKYLLDAVEFAKSTGVEATLANAYNTLGNLYRETDSLKKGIDIRTEQMEFHFGRREYEKVVEIYQKVFNWLSDSNHKNRANEFEAEWRARFSKIEGGIVYFEKGSGKHAADKVSAEKLHEQITLASSSGDMRAEAEAYVKLAHIVEQEDPKLAAEHLVQAASCYSLIDDRAARLDAMETALKILFDKGQIVDIMTYDNVILFADDETFEGIARIWRDIGDMAYCAHRQKQGKMYVGDQQSILNEAIGKLLALGSKNEYLAVCCILDMAEFLVETLSEDAIISLVGCISDEYKQNVIDEFDDAMGKNTSADFNYLMNNYFGDQADRLIQKYEKYINALIELDGDNTPAFAGNLALIFRRRKEKEKAFSYHALSADIYRRKGKIDDCFIEIMNGATARKELSSTDEAIELLREGLKEAIEKANRKFAAMIAGNLASMLMSEMKEDDRTEIESCFAIEERYFRASGSWRDLVVSLVNQSIFYIKTSAPISRVKSKVEEAKRLATEAKLDEFSTLISRLEWSIAQSEGGNNHSEETVRENIASLFAENGYRLYSFDRKDGYYYAVTIPEAEDKTYQESLHIAAPFDKGFFLRVIGVMHPAIYKDDCKALEEYIEWWNRLDKYTLMWNKEERYIKVVADLLASDRNQLSERLQRFILMWNADKTNCISLIMNIVDLDDCRHAKLKTVE